MTNVTQAPDAKLVVSVRRFSDESLLGYLVRLGEANGYLSPKTVINLLEQQTGRHVRVLAEIAADFKIIEAMEIVSDAARTSLTAWAWRAIDSANGPYFNVRGASIPVDALMTGHAQVCPICLAEGGYCREDWELSGMTVCPCHAVPLIDRCPNCQKFLEILRSPMVSCGHCHFDLRQAPTGMATQQEILVADYIGALAPYRLSHGSEESIDYAESLFALAQTMSFGTEHVLQGNWSPSHFQSLPVENRREALGCLAFALDGSAINGVVLHGILLLHVAHRLPYLPRALALQPLVEFLQKNQFLSPTARCLLSYGNTDVALSASQRFNGRPPQFHRESEVMAFLKCTEDTWRWLRKHGHIHLPPEGLGFDADEVLAAQDRLECFVSLAEMDRKFGVPNLTRYLIEWHVLPSATSPRDEWTAVDLVTIGLILDRLRLLGTADGPHDSQVWTRVCESPLAAVDLAEAYSAVIARALRADVVGIRWAAPYAMQDLFVLPADVERLTPPHPSKTTDQIDKGRE